MEDQPLFAFVLMPFKTEFGDVYHLGIKEAANAVGIVAERLDEQMFGEGMLERIYRQIEAADIIIADMTGQNANVFYEVGWAHAKGKLCILLTKDAKDIPFDLKHRRHIEYKDSVTYLKSELIKNLEWAKVEVENVRKSNLRVELLTPDGDLYISKSRFVANATIKFKANIYNDSNQSSVEISAIYLYMGREWDVSQSGNQCPSTESDVPDYNYRYFLNPPVSRLAKNSWAQLQFQTTRQVANKLHGDVIQDEYRLNGYFMFRFVTPNGHFDYEQPVDITVVNIPF